MENKYRWDWISSQDDTFEVKCYAVITDSWNRKEYVLLLTFRAVKDWKSISHPKERQIYLQIYTLRGEKQLKFYVDRTKLGKKPLQEYRNRQTKWTFLILPERKWMEPETLDNLENLVIEETQKLIDSYAVAGCLVNQKKNSDFTEEEHFRSKIKPCVQTFFPFWFGFLTKCLSRNNKIISDHRHNFLHKREGSPIIKDPWLSKPSSSNWYKLKLISSDYKQLELEISSQRPFPVEVKQGSSFKTVFTERKYEWSNTQKRFASLVNFYKERKEQGEIEYQSSDWRKTTVRIIQNIRFESFNKLCLFLKYSAAFNAWTEFDYAVNPVSGEKLNEHQFRSKFDSNYKR